MCPQDTEDQIHHSVSVNHNKAVHVLGNTHSTEEAKDQEAKFQLTVILNYFFSF